MFAVCIKLCKVASVPGCCSEQFLGLNRLPLWWLVVEDITHLLLMGKVSVLHDSYR